MSCPGGPGRHIRSDGISGAEETREQPGRRSKVDDGREGYVEGTGIWDEGGALSSTDGFEQKANAVWKATQGCRQEN